MRLQVSMLLTLSLVAGTAALACGGSKKTSNESNGRPAPAIDAQASESSEDKFARQRADAVDKMCQRLVDCSLADAEKNAPPEELAEINKNREAITAAALDNCNAEYGAVEMSPRQVVALRECLGEPTECSEFNACLEAGMKPADDTASE